MKKSTYIKTKTCLSLENKSKLALNFAALFFLDFSSYENTPLNVLLLLLLYFIYSLFLHFFIYLSTIFYDLVFASS